MKKKLIWAAAAVIMLMFAIVPVTVAEESEPGEKQFTLAGAKEVALKNNHQVELAVLGVEKAQLAVDEAEFAKKKMLDLDIKDQNAAMVIDVVPKQAQAGKAIADTALKFTKNSIEYGVEAAYYGVLKAEELLKVSRASYQRSQEQLKLAQARFKAGTAAKMDVISAEAQLKSAEAGVNEAESALKVAKMSLCKTLNLNLSTPVKVTEKFSFQAAPDIDTDQVFQEMTEKDLSYVTDREGLDFNKVNFEYHKTYFVPKTFKYRDALYRLKEGEVKFNNARAELEFNIKKAYLDLKTAEDNYLVLTKSLEQAQEAYRLNKLRYQVGLATNFDVLNAEAALLQAEMGVSNALYNFNLAKSSFTYGIFGGAGSAGVQSGSGQQM